MDGVTSMREQITWENKYYQYIHKGIDLKLGLGYIMYLSFSIYITNQGNSD